ncbi:MAG: FRG domain-containing protein [Erysipelotrichales bacterium]|nr:FRG domain-containing protein [Erysipelotrichales bacterium]
MFEQKTLFANNIAEYIKAISEIQTENSKIRYNELINCMIRLQAYDGKIKNAKNDKELEETINKYIRFYTLFSSKQINNLKSDNTKNDDKFVHENQTDTFYRGVFRNTYSLLPGVYRKPYLGHESYLLHNVIARSPNNFNNKSHLDTLVTLQHYECPTRLLDITSNPLVALYFACKDFTNGNKDPNNFGYVYVFLNPKQNLLYKDSDKSIIVSCLSKFNAYEQKELYKACINRIKKTKDIAAKFNEKNNGTIVEKLYHEIRSEVNFDKELYVIDILRNYFVQPDLTNNRIMRQSGAFIISGLSKDEKTNESKIKDMVYCKIEIHNQEEILKELDKFGINEATLFPELDRITHYYKSKLK